MADFLVVVLVLGFFALCVAFVYGCDHIIGRDDSPDVEFADESEGVVPGDVVAEVTR